MERRLRLQGCSMSIENKLEKFSGLKPDETRLSESQMIDRVRSESSTWATHRSGTAALRGGIPSPKSIFQNNVRTGSGVVQVISHKHCRLLQRANGYGYSQIAKQKGMREQALSLPGMIAEVSRAIG